MNAARVNALIASSYNLHVGPAKGGAPMTPDAAAKLPTAERASLCKLLEERGGSDLYTRPDAAKAFAHVTSQPNATNPTHEAALRDAQMLMEMGVEPRSALKQAAADRGVAYGAPMGMFVKWAEQRLSGGAK